MKSQSYKLFEEAFRGSRHDILLRLGGYTEILTALSVDASPTALDLGCGRGEWLELVGQFGFEATGVDLNSQFVDQCLSMGLRAVCSDLFQHLAKVPDQSVLLLSAFHLIEHLPQPAVAHLLEQAHRILRPNGLLLLETPSIDHLLVGTKSFYSDPTHITPIHPESLCFLLQESGFNWAQPFYINAVGESSISNHPLAYMLSGVAQDVCILGVPDASQSLLLHHPDWQRSLHLAPTTLAAAHACSAALQDRLRLMEQRLLVLEAFVATARKALYPLRFARRVHRRLLSPLPSLPQWRTAIAARLRSSGVFSRQHRRLVSAVLKRLGLYGVAFSMYQRHVLKLPPQLPFAPPVVQRRVLRPRAAVIMRDLRPVHFSWRGAAQ